MLRQCVVLAVLGCAFAVPIAVPQYQTHQQPEAIPPQQLRQYLENQAAPTHTQALPRPVQIPGAIPAPTRLPYSAQSEGQYQPQPQQQYQPQPQQYQPQPQQQYQAQQQYQPQPQYRAQQQYQQPKQQEQQYEKEDYDPSPSYQFGFDVNDDQYTNYQNRKEQREGNVIKGSYSVVDSDGFIRTVTYTADPKEGFKAEVQRQPTDIVVKIPTPKPQALQHQVAPQPRPQQPPPEYYRYQQ